MTGTDSTSVRSQASNALMDVDEPAAARSGEKKPVLEYASGGHAVLAEGEFVFTIPAWVDVVKHASDTTQRRPDGPPARLSQDREAFEAALSATGKLESDVFEIGGYKWRLSVFPVGNQAMSRDEVGLYVAAVEEESPPDWSVCAQFIVAISPAPTRSLESIGDRKIFAKPSDHRFDASEADWGFGQYVTHRQLVRDGLIAQDGSLTFYVRLRTVADPTGVLWHSFINYNSKRSTGFVGLQNQGATCYMNSLLQSLFLINSFRKAAYAIPTVDADPSDSIPLALQRVFYRLQTADAPVGTTELTRSFGWDSLDAFMQHDVQEFSRVLLDDLESKMKGTSVEGAIGKLFVGKMRNVVKCLNVDFESVREEHFYDLQLAVKGMRTLEDSFASYIHPEMLDGSNKYQAEGHGLQDAKRFVAFEKFPPVLNCHLVRYTFDPQTGDIAKFNGRLEFPKLLDLSPYISPDSADRVNPQIYLLHSVLVHSGDSHGGHYFVFCRDPRQPDRWFKFDDTRVIRVTEREAVEDNFGSDDSDTASPSDAASGTQQTRGLKLVKRFTNAYMLVYIRATEVDAVLAPVLDLDIPSHIPSRIYEDDLVEERKRTERLQHLQACPLLLLTDDIIKQHSGFDLCNTEPNGQPITTPVKLEMRRDDTVGRLRAMAAMQLGLFSIDASITEIDKQTAKVSLWTCATRKNRTVRIDQQLLPSMDNRQLGVFSPAQARSLPIFYATIKQEEGEDVYEGTKGKLLLWFKTIEPSADEKSKSLLFPSNLHMRTLGWLMVSPADQLSSESIQGKLSSTLLLAGTAQSPAEEQQSWRYFEELKPGRIELLSAESSFERNELRTGDIIVIARPGVNVPAYYEDLQACIAVDLVPIDAHRGKKGSSVASKTSLPLSVKMSGQQVLEAAAKALGCQTDSLRLVLADRLTDLPSNVAVKTETPSLADLLRRGPTVQQPTHIVLFYEVLHGVTAREAEHLTPVFVYHEDRQRQVYLPSSSTVSAVFSKLGITDDAALVLLEVANHRIVGVHGPKAALMLSSRDDYRVASIPKAVDDAKPSLLIAVFHYYRDPSIMHGDPFLFPLLPSEPFSETQRRLAALARRPDEQPEDISVSYIRYGRPYPLLSASTDAGGEGPFVDELREVGMASDGLHILTLSAQLGVNHAPMTSKSSTSVTGGGERSASIRIKHK